MGRRGPAPEPTALKLLRGNPGKRAINRDEPKLAPADPSPPRGLSGRALAVWKEYGPALIVAGVLKASDTPVFRTFCEIASEVEKYTKLCTKVGPENASRLGYPKRLDTLRKQQREYSAVLGLNPSARSALKITPERPATDPDAEFLLGKRTGS